MLCTGFKFGESKEKKLKLKNVDMGTFKNYLDLWCENGGRLDMELGEVEQLSTRETCVGCVVDQLQILVADYPLMIRVGGRFQMNGTCYSHLTLQSMQPFDLFIPYWVRELMNDELFNDVDVLFK